MPGALHDALRRRRILPPLHIGKTAKRFLQALKNAIVHQGRRRLDLGMCIVFAERDVNHVHVVGENKALLAVQCFYCLNGPSPCHDDRHDTRLRRLATTGRLSIREACAIHGGPSISVVEGARTESRVSTSLDLEHCGFVGHRSEDDFNVFHIRDLRFITPHTAKSKRGSILRLALGESAASPHRYPAPKLEWPPRHLAQNTASIFCRHATTRR